MLIKCKYKALILFIPICFFAWQAWGNTIYEFHNLTPQMGLSEANVSSIFRDHQGFLWVGTYDGLNKYDGIDFEYFQYESDNPNSLSANDVKSVFEDSYNTLWIGTVKGINRYNRDMNNFDRVLFNDTDSNEVVEVKKIIEDKKGQVWVAANKGVYKFNIERNVFEKMFQEHYTQNNLPFCEDITIDKKGNLWIGFSTKVLKVDFISNNITVYNNKSGKNRLSANGIICVHADNQNRLWIGYYNSGLDRIDIETGALETYENINNNSKSLSNNYVMSIIEDGENNIWIGTDNGLNIYNETSNNFTRLHSTGADNSMLTDIIQCAYVDNEGSIYFGCRGGGVSMHDKRMSKFKKFTPQVGNLNSLSSSSVIAFTEDANQKIWIAVDGGGINYFNPTTNEFKHFKHLPQNKNSLTNNKVLAVVADNNNGLWAGMWQGGLCYYKIVNNSLVFQRKYLKVNNDDPESTSVFDLYKSANGDIWVGTYGSGAFKYNKQAQRFDQIKLNTNTNKNFNYQSVVDMLDDGDNYIWFCTLDDGLIKYNKKTGLHKQFKASEESNDSLPSLAVNAIVKDLDGNIWVGTANGLSRFNAQNLTFKTFTIKNGLPSNLIYGLLLDNTGNLWCSTNRGLAEINIVSNDSIYVKSFTIIDGLQDNYFNPWAYFKSSTGSLYFGGIKGFNTFNPEKINYNKVVPKVYLTEFLLFNEPITNYKQPNSVLKKHIKETQKIVLNHNQFNFTLRFRALNLINSEQNSYAFILENLEDKWNYVGNQKSATYTKIPHGEYIFRVKASNNDGVWNEKGAAVHITILPPWYKTWAFKIALVVLIVIIIFIIYSIRVSSLKEQKKILEQSVKQRTKELESANVELAKKQNEIQQQNQELIASEEELQQLNEELLATNDQLYHQKEELEATLQNLKETQSQLVQSEKMASLGILTSGIAHEINNPLNFIQGGKFQMEMQIKQHCPDKASLFKPIIDIIDEGIKRATKIVSSLNQFNRKTESYNEECNIHNIIENCLLILHSKMEFRIEVQKELNNDDLIVLGNDGELHQVFLNVLTNAVQAIDEQGTIQIITHATSDKTGTVQIKDSGKGILEENIDKITSPFFTTKEPGEGTGLGMSISYAILKKHGALLKYNSEPHKGTTVTLTFPLK